MLKLAIPNAGRDFLCPFLWAVEQCAYRPSSSNISTYLAPADHWEFVCGNLLKSYFKIQFKPIERYCQAIIKLLEPILLLVPYCAEHIYPYSYKHFFIPVHFVESKSSNA